MPLNLRLLLPKFHLIEGCYLIELDEGVPDSSEVADELERYKADRKRYEEDCNRCFVVRNFLDYLGVAYTDLADDGMLAVAEFVAAIIRDGLHSHFPDVQFDVEIVGGNSIDDEPLELCVTFSRTA